MINLFSGFEQSRREHIPLLKGGLGNRLFQVAATYSIARQKNEAFVLDINLCEKNPHSSIKYEQTIFKHFLQKSSGSLRRSITYKQDNSHFYDPMLFQESKYSYYDGYFQHYKYFDPCLDELRQLFVLPVLPETRRFFIHIRLGDYINNKHHYVNLEKYYQTCLDIIQQQHGSQVEFCVMTNDPSSAEEYIANHLPLVRSYTFGNADELMALSEMSQCTLGGICANSTFSWWGGLLNSRKNKQIFFPKKIYPDTSQYKDSDIQGMFHPEFTIIDV